MYSRTNNTYEVWCVCSWDHSKFKKELQPTPLRSIFPTGNLERRSARLGARAVSFDTNADAFNWRPGTLSKSAKHRARLHSVLLHYMSNTTFKKKYICSGISGWYALCRFTISMPLKKVYKKYNKVCITSQRTLLCAAAQTLFNR